MSPACCIILTMVLVVVLLMVCGACMFYMQKAKKAAFEGPNYGWTKEDVTGGYYLGPSYGCGQQSAANQCRAWCTGAPAGESYARCLEGCL